jgi:hypothetical protein
MPNYSDEPERPRAEPEIIPPGRGNGRGRGPAWPQPPFGFTQNHGPQNHGSQNYGSQRVFVGRIGPLGFALLLAMVGLFGAVMLLVLIGTALIWIPVIAVFLIIAAVGGLIRRL